MLSGFPIMSSQYIICIFSNNCNHKKVVDSTPAQHAHTYKVSLVNKLSFIGLHLYFNKPQNISPYIIRKCNIQYLLYLAYYIVRNFRFYITQIVFYSNCI